MFASTLDGQDFYSFQTGISPLFYNNYDYGLCFETFNSSQFNFINDDSLEDKIISANNLISEHLSNFLDNPDVDYLLGIAYGQEFNKNLAKSLLVTQISQGF